MSANENEHVTAAIQAEKWAALAAAERESAAARAAAASPAVPGPPKTKAGFFTSEFWLAAIALASNVLTHSGLVTAASDGQHSMSAIGSALVAVVLCVQYVTGRTVLKSNAGVSADSVAADVLKKMRDAAAAVADQGKAAKPENGESTE